MTIGKFNIKEWVKGAKQKFAKFWCGLIIKLQIIKMASYLSIFFRLWGESKIQWKGLHAFSACSWRFQVVHSEFQFRRGLLQSERQLTAPVQHETDPIQLQQHSAPVEQKQLNLQLEPPAGGHRADRLRHLLVQEPAADGHHTTLHSLQWVS